METPNRKRGREGTKAFQFFLPPLPVQRFRAACALNNVDPSEAIERMMGDFADRHGIPKQPAEPKETPKRHSPQPGKPNRR